MYLLLIAAAASILAVSCKREKDPSGPESQAEKTHVIDDSTPMPVIFTSQYVATKAPEIETKGLGAIDDWHGAGQQLYVYGFPYIRVDKGVNAYEWINYGNPLMVNVAADAPTAESDHEGVRLDGSQRAKINVYNALAEGGLAAMEPYYYRENQENGNDEAFSFFAYFVDDAIADPAPVVTPGSNPPTYNPDGSADVPGGITHGKIVLEGLILDGTQDIMLATTDKEVDALARSRYFDRETYQTSELNDDDLGEYVDAKTVYSAHAARRGVNPDLIFEHQLSRITFYIKKGGTVPSSDITVAGIDLFDYYEGTLTIADGVSGLGGDRGLAPVNTGTLNPGVIDWDFTDAWQDDVRYKDEVPEYPDAGLNKYVKTVRKADNPDYPITAADDIHPYKDYNRFGQSVLVFPGREKIDMVLRILQNGATAPGYRPYKMHLEIENDPDVNGQPVLFEAGKNYNVYLTVYGLEEVRISVTLTEWDDANIILDPDDDDDDLREAAQILLGTDRTEDPTGIVSHIGAPANVTYEAEGAAYLPYLNPSVIPHGELSIRSCDKFDLLSDKMFVKGDPNALTPTEDHYEDVLPYVRSNSNGEFHFSIEGIDPTYDDRGLRVYSHAKVTVTEDGLIDPQDVTGDTPVSITVRQNSTNDYLAAVPRVIDLTILPDDRVPVQINWNDKTGADAPAEAALVVLNEDGASNTLDMNATFTIDYDKNGINPASDVTYVLTYENVGTAMNPIYGWAAVKKITGDPLCGPGAISAAFEVGDPEYVRFDLRFEVTAGNDVIRVDPLTGIITALQAGNAKVKMYLTNLPNDDTYQPCEKEINVKVVRPTVVISNVPAELTIKYGEKYTFKPVVSAGAAAISYVSATPASVSVGADNGIILGKVVGGPVNITVTVADGPFYAGASATCAVTVEKADPVVTVRTKTINATDVSVPSGDCFTIEDPIYAGEGIAAYNGTPITYVSSDENVFTVAADGSLTGVAAGRGILTVQLPSTDSFNAYNAEVAVVVKAVANTFNPHDVNVVAGGVSDAAWDTADGDVTLNAVTKAGVPVPSFGSKFSLTGDKKVSVSAGVAAGSYVLTLHAAGDAQHVAATEKIIVTVTAAP